MADYPTTDLNSQLIAAGLNPGAPTQTYVDFANKMAQNQQEQAANEQAIARAKELTTQAKLQSRQGLGAEAAGYNPELVNTMTPAEAAAYLHLILKEKGLTISQDDVDAWVQTLPPVVNRQIVESFANRFARETTRAGIPAQFDKTDKLPIPAGSTAEDLGLVADPNDPKIGHVPNDGMYSVLYDNQGEIKKYIPAGKEPVDQTEKLHVKEAESTEKQWQKLDAAINQFLKSTRGNQLTTTIIRAARSLNELANEETLTPQVLSYIQKDTSGIFQGGVPPQAAMADEDFSTAWQKANGFIQKYTGISGMFKSDIGNQRMYLLGLISRLREGAVDTLKKLVLSEESGYKKIIDEDPSRWEKMVEDKIATATSGLSATAIEQTKIHEMPTTPVQIPGVKTGVPGAPKAKGVVPKYTVE